MVQDNSKNRACQDIWHLSHRADSRALPLANRHYNRQHPNSKQFVPPGSCLVLLTPDADALWVTSVPRAQYVKHAWAGAWTCSLFRNESPYRSSDLIRKAVAITRWRYGEPPPQGFITFVDTRYTQSPNPGYCYKCAGWHYVGKTKRGLIALQLLPSDMSEIACPL